MMRRRGRVGLGQSALTRYRNPTMVPTTILFVAAIIGGGFNRNKALLVQAAQCTATPTAAIRVGNAADAETLRAAVNCTDGGQVDAVWAASVSLTSTIVIGGNTFLNVTGEDGAEALGSGSRIFEVSADGGLDVSELRLSGGTEVTGGAIYSSSGSLRLENCVVDSNFASDGGGGAIWAKGGDLTIVGGEFSDNGAKDKGGAVFAVDAGLTVEGGARFESNQATEGGAIYCANSVSDSSSTKTCSFSDAVFVTNNASWTTPIILDDYETPWVMLTPDGLPRGGAVSVSHVEAGVADCVFESNYAQLAGGAVFGGNDSAVMVDACTFSNNTTPGFGAGMAVSTVTVTGGTEMEFGHTVRHGGAIFAWDLDGDVDLQDMTCRENVGEGNGGCLYASGGATIREGVSMKGDQANLGGCIYATGGSDIKVMGGEFTCKATKNGGFLFASDGGKVDISGGLVDGCLAVRRAGAVYCSGDSFDLDGSVVSISGGTFSNNEALELGGALVAWGDTTVVTVTGGVFVNNTARYYGGFVFLEEQASIRCNDATIEGNFAGDQGGAVYARDPTWVNMSCDILGNSSPQGAAAYLTHIKENALFENMSVTNNIASGASIVYIAESPFVARDVTFAAGSTSIAAVTSRAVQIDSLSTFKAQGCLFEGWEGDAIVHSVSDVNGSLVLDRCDFSGSWAETVVSSSLSYSEVRNARVSQLTFTNAANPLALVDRALTCEDAGVCGEGACFDSSLGVLCECLPNGGACLDDGATLSVVVKTPPDNVTFSPDYVSFELLVSASAAEEDGTTDAIWVLTYDSDKLALDIVPSSGILSPGDNTVVSVSGVPLEDDVGGDLTNSFTLTTVAGSDGVDGSSSTAVAELEVVSTFYLCSAFQFAVPTDDSSSGATDGGQGIECEQCLELSGDAEGVDCTSPGATLASLPVRAGYWRESKESRTIHSCVYSGACAGATQVATSNDYCASGYKGPYCAICSEGYGMGVGTSCHACDNTGARFLIALGAVFILLVVAFLVLILVFLIGGLDAVVLMRDSIVSTLTSKPSSGGRAVGEGKGRSGNSAVHGGNDDRDVASSSVDVVASSTATVFAPALDIASSSAQGGHEEKSSSAERVALGGGQTAGEEVPERAETIDASVSAGAGGGRRDASGTPGTVRGTFGPVHDLDMLNRSSRSTVPDVVPRRNVGLSSPQVSASGYEHRNGTEAPTAGLAAMHTVGSDGAVASGGRGRGVGTDAVGPARSREEGSGCCRLGPTVKGWMSRLPLDKLKILVVVWQIVTVFPTIAAVEYPPSYARFLDWIDVVNLDLGHIFSATCLLPAVNHYERLLAVTLGPLFLGGVLLCTYQLAKRRAGIGSVGVMGRRSAWSRHMAAGLLLTFLVFTSTSTVIFRTFACDYEAVEGKSYLRADYRLSCNTGTHTLFKIYAAFMILVYPVGIPVLYFYILWSKRESLNPMLQRPTEEADGGDVESDLSVTSHKTVDSEKARAEAKELEEKIQTRKLNPDLVPSIFLWKDFGPDLYYYEVIECGRRILLTGVLIFIAPNTAAQAAMACIFAFASLLGFELLRPHLDPTDSWLYRLGCVIIFLSNFLALLIKADAAGEDRREALGGLLVAINLGLILAVILTSWFATTQSVADSRADDNTFALTKTIATNELLASTRRLQTRDRRHAHMAAPVAPLVTSGVVHGRSGSGVTPLPLVRIGGGSGSVCGGFRSDDGWSDVGSRGSGVGVGGGVGGGKRVRMGKDMAEKLWEQDKGMGDRKSGAEG